MLDIKTITKHMFQNGLAHEFSIPVTVEFGLIGKPVDVTIMRQSILPEFTEMKDTEPLWTDVIITLSPKVMMDVEVLHDAYVSARTTIKGALTTGSVFA